LISLGQPLTNSTKSIQTHSRFSFGHCNWSSVCASAVKVATMCHLSQQCRLPSPHVNNYTTTKRDVIKTLLRNFTYIFRHVPGSDNNTNNLYVIQRNACVSVCFTSLSTRTFSGELYTLITGAHKDLSTLSTSITRLA